MSSHQVLLAANLTRQLEHDDFRVLMGIELGMRRFDAPPLEQISFYSRLDRSATQFRLDKLHKLGILQRYSDLGYIGYQLISEAYDVLALHALVEKGIIIGVGVTIGQGKESDVYFVQLPDKTSAAIKIHRIGRTSFRQVRKFRSYTKGRRHISWLYVNRLSAEREYLALQRLEPLNIGIPHPIAQNRHMVVMSLINGVKLSEIVDLENPQKVLERIMNQMERIFVQCGMIHCDLSEYNILITEDQQPLIIDWPQWQSAEHPNVISYLTRDIGNIAHFFLTRFKLIIDVDKSVTEFISRRKEYILLHPEARTEVGKEPAPEFYSNSDDESSIPNDSEIEPKPEQNADLEEPKESAPKKTGRKKKSTK